MDSVDDSITTSSADRSIPGSSSSQDSQPTVKLNVSNVLESNGHRRSYRDIGRKQKYYVADQEPFLQSLGHEGRRLVESAGRTAQKNRVLIRQGLKFDNRFRDVVQLKRNVEHCRQMSERRPRKWHSMTSVLSRDRNTYARFEPRHNSYGVETLRRSWSKPETPKRYSAGDFLRQQILEDLSSNELIGKTEEQIAEDRCNRIKAYLRRRTDDSSYVAPQVRLRELRNCWKSEEIARSNDILRDNGNATRREDLDRIKAYLGDKIRAKMNEEESRRRRTNELSNEYSNELSIRDIRRRYSDSRRSAERRDYPTRRVYSDANVRREMTFSSESGRDEESLPKPAFPRKRNDRVKSNVSKKMRSHATLETTIDPAHSQAIKGFQASSGAHCACWKTMSCNMFEKKFTIPRTNSMNLNCQSDSPLFAIGTKDHKNTNKSFRTKNRKKYYRKTRSDTLPELLPEINVTERKAERRCTSWSDKRRLRRTSSERHFNLLNRTSLNTQEASSNNRWRTNIQQGSLCSWHDYKEKWRQERRDWQSTLCGTDEGLWRNHGECSPKRDSPKAPANDPIQEYIKDECTNRHGLFGISDELKAITMKRLTNTSEKTNDDIRRTEETPEDTENETIIQENYLLLEQRYQNVLRDSGVWSPIISKLQVNEYRNLDFSLPSELIDAKIDCDAIQKDCHETACSRNKCIGFNVNSNVKKRPTFKIVDGSETPFDNRVQQVTVQDNFDISPRSSNCTMSFARGQTFGDSGAVAVIDAIDNINDFAISASTPVSDDDTLTRSNAGIAGDYFKRVYESLKERQDNGKRDTTGALGTARDDRDTSSSNNTRNEVELRKQRRRRRRKKDKLNQGEEFAVVESGVGGDDGWTVQELLVNDDPGGNLIFHRPLLRNVAGNKRACHPAAPIPSNCKINAKDIRKYFDYPNKENSSPRNGVNENKERIERNESKGHQCVDTNKNEMGSNLSRYNGKCLTGRRTQSSGNLCDPKGKINHVGKILVPCSSAQKERYKICGSLPNHLDDKEILDDENPRGNNTVISDTMIGNLGGTLPHKKRSLGVHFSDTGPTGTLDLVKHRSQDSLEGDPWRYQDGTDLDLVRCKHGHFDLVRKNQNADAVDGDSTSQRYGTLGNTLDSKCHHDADLDLVGALPKRRHGKSKGAALRQSTEAQQNRAVDRVGGDLLTKVMHKPDCELMKHRQFDYAVDLKLSRLIGGEPQDQGYASERSPEDERPPSLSGQPFPTITPENTFSVVLQKCNRGLGLSVSGGGTAGPVRVKRLFPQQPAALSNKLQPGDILLAANDIPLTGLTNYEALEVLRTTPSTVELVVCRVPGEMSITPPGAPPPPPARREPPPPLRLLNPLPPLQIEPCGEFDIEMTKVEGSLGFTLRKVDSSALGHYVRALVREPALSDGRIQPGDKIVAVDGATLSPMSHEEAVVLLRQCGPRVKLRLYRDLAQTPVSALSPTEPDHPLRPPRTSLRQEAVDMLCDLAVRKLSPGTSNGSNSRQTSGASCNSPRRRRRPLSRTPTTENEQENHLTFHPVHPTTTSHTGALDTNECSINTELTTSQLDKPVNDIIDPPPLYDAGNSNDSSKFAPRPSFLDLDAPEKPHFQFSLESDSVYTGPIIVTESDSNLTAECDYRDDSAKNTLIVSSDEQDNNLPSEPASMPPLLSPAGPTRGVFSYKNPAYQSANPTCSGVDNSAKNKAAHSSDQDIPGKVLGTEDPLGSKGLLKWKGVMFAPNDSIDEITREKVEVENTGKDNTTESATQQSRSDDGIEVFMVELTRGWNSRLGFSLQPEGNSTVISVVHPDSVAAKDGRLKQGDILTMVNDESVENMSTADIIDLLRKIRGSIGITVMRKNKTQNLS